VTPDFMIKVVGGKNITKRIRDRFISLSINDSVDTESDSMSLVLDDRDGLLETPITGTKFEVWMGYKNKKLSYRGKFVYDFVDFGLVPRTMTIKAHATNFKDEIKAPRSRSWDEVTLGDIVNTIAADHNYEAFIHPDLESESIVHIDQTSESDLHLLTRLKKDYGATFKIAGGYLLFMPRAGKVSAKTQAALPVITLRPGDISTGGVTRNDRSKYGAVMVKYYDFKEAKTLNVLAGEGTPVYEVKGTKATKAEAEAAAKAKYKRLQRTSGDLNFTLPGRGDLVAESSVLMKEWRDGVDGEWSTLDVSHVIDDKGYRCTVDAESV